jgi:hypothetical protein
LGHEREIVGGRDALHVAGRFDQLAGRKRTQLGCARFTSSVSDLAGEEPVQVAFSMVVAGEMLAGFGIPAAGDTERDAGMFGTRLHDPNLPACAFADLPPRERPLLVAGQDHHGPGEAAELVS